MTTQRTLTNPFDVRDNRVMVSLGPLSQKKYCTYSCPFCYVHTDFFSYASMTIPEIIQWIEKVETPFDIIYVSGDTDSFAPPRTEEGIQLIESLVRFGTDVLFTTRYVFTSLQLKKIEAIQQRLANNGNLLFGCVSVAQLSFPHLEPKPIAHPKERLNQLKSFKDRGLISVLAMRPFLPIVPISEYKEIVDLAQNSVDVILGEVWYADKAGKLEQGVFQGNIPLNIPYVEHRMDFDINEATWKIFEATDIEKAIEEYCRASPIPFFMRSRPAIEWVKAKRRS